MTERDELDFLVCSATVFHPGDDNVLRDFDAVVEAVEDTGTHRIGTARGWIGWDVWGDDFYDSADAISGDAEALAAYAVEIVEQCADVVIENLLFIDRIVLDARRRGRRLTGSIVDELLELFRLEPSVTLVVLYPEPLQETGAPYEPGPVRDAAMRRLTEAYRIGGFEPWGTSPVWWRPLESATVER